MGGRRDGATRRAFIAGAGLAGAAQFVPLGLGAVAAGAEQPKPCTPTAPTPLALDAAVTRGGRVWTADGALRTITEHRAPDFLRGRAIDLGASPVALAIAGRLAAVVTGSFDRPALLLVDLPRGAVLERIDVGKDPVAVSLTPDGATAAVLGAGEQATLTVVDVAAKRRAHTPIDLGRAARNIVLTPDGRTALVTLAEGAVAVVDLRRGKVRRRIATKPLPAALAVAPDGRHAAVTHDGVGPGRVSLLDLERGRVARVVTVGADPASVAYAAAGRRLLVAERGTGRVTTLDARTGHRRARRRAGHAPRAVLAARGRVLAVDGDTGRVTVVKGAIR